MKLNLTPILSTKFHFDPEGKVFTAEDSELGGYNFQQRIYDDACDIGMAIQSPNGEVVTFVFSHDEKHDGDTLAWHFTMIPEDQRKYPTVKGNKVIIFND